MRFCIVVLILSLLVVERPGFADSCDLTSSTPASNRVYSVTGFFVQGQWLYCLTKLKTGRQHIRPLPNVGSHAHLQFLLSDDGKHFAVLDPSADHRLTNRLMILTLSGKLVASLGIQDLLTPEEQARVGHSISHISWLQLNPMTGGCGSYLVAENAVGLVTMTGRPILVSMSDGKLITKRQ